jgi:hypothetical protein
MPSDLIRNVWKKLQDRFTILPIHTIEPRRITSKGIALINEIQIQDSCSSDEESAAVS